MGGYGSSRWGAYTPKTTVEDCRILTLGEFTRKGFVGPNLHQNGTVRWRKTATQEEVASIGWEIVTHDDAGWMRLNYTVTPYCDHENKRHIDYKVHLVTTQPHMGGLRWWFICPGLRCGGHRVAKLYHPPGEDYYLCRECYDLVYRSSQEHDKKMDRFRHMSWDTLASLMRRDSGTLEDQSGSIHAAQVMLDRYRNLV